MESLRLFVDSGRVFLIFGERFIYIHWIFVAAFLAICAGVAACLLSWKNSHDARP